MSLNEDKLRPNILLYHCNFSEKCKNFLCEDSGLIWSNEDGIYLGDGMYFWDNISNAEYWEKIKQKSSKDTLILRCNVFVDKLLDLTDKDICNKVNELWKELNNSMIKRRDYNIYNGKTYLGDKLNLLFKELPTFSESYYVIKAYYKYNKTPQSNLFKYNIYDKIIEPVLNIKCIYNVKNNSVIGYKEVVIKEKSC